MQAQEFVQISARFLEKLKATGPGVTGTALPQGLVLLNAFQVRLGLGWTLSRGTRQCQLLDVGITA